MATINKSFFLVFLILLFLNTFIGIRAQEQNYDILNYRINIPERKSTVYQHLSWLSQELGYNFVYSSQIADNNKEILLPEGRYTVLEAIYTIIGNPSLDVSQIEKHIVISQPEYKADILKKLLAQEQRSNFLRVDGVIRDQQTQESIPYAAVSISNTSIGTIANAEGEFRLVFPDSLSNSQLKITHIGYKTFETSIRAYIQRVSLFHLTPVQIPLSEVIVERVDPWETVKKMVEKRYENYYQDPAYMYIFYREGTVYKKEESSLSEAVLKVYKAPWGDKFQSDQVKMLKMRKIKSEDEEKIMIAKLKAGINASLDLDIVKKLYHFLQSGEDSDYDYFLMDKTKVDGRMVNVIYFQQKKHYKIPLYQGRLYIDTEDYALVQADFEINPKYMKKIKPLVIVKKTSDLDVMPQRIKYSVTYKMWDGKYHLSHVRGDLYFKANLEKRLFKTSYPFHTWFELVNCEIETEKVKRFPRKERIDSEKIFSEMEFIYDKDFWGNFNIIMPEDKLKDFISDYFYKQDNIESLP